MTCLPHGYSDVSDNTTVHVGDYMMMTVLMASFCLRHFKDADS